jgi:hypothetical protein
VVQVSIEVGTEILNNPQRSRLVLF